VSALSYEVDCQGGRVYCITGLARIHVRREALTIRVEVRDLHRCSCRSRTA
jgi:hypothetical protein